MAPSRLLGLRSERRCDGGSHRKPGEFDGPPRVEAGSHDRPQAVRPAGDDQPPRPRDRRAGRRGGSEARSGTRTTRSAASDGCFGSGMTTAGRKYLAGFDLSGSTARSSRFGSRPTRRVTGRAPSRRGRANPYRIAFVGDSFTEGMQVEYDKTFCDLIERGLAGAWQGREVVCENYGIAATGLFEYWHRITHDVLRPDAAGRSRPLPRRFRDRDVEPPRTGSETTSRLGRRRGRDGNRFPCPCGAEEHERRSMVKPGSHPCPVPGPRGCRDIELRSRLAAASISAPSRRRSRVQ